MNREAIMLFSAVIFFVVVVVFAIGILTGMVPKTIFHGKNLLDAAVNGIKAIIPGI